MAEVVVGRFPPPLGGVSVFVQRKFLSIKERGGKYIDFGEKAWILSLVRLSARRDNVFLLNSASLKVLAVFFVFGILSRTILYDHNASRHLWRNNLLAFVYIFFVRRLLAVRVVHQHLVDEYGLRGCGDKVAVESPFIPPNESERQQVLGTYPREVVEFINDPRPFKVVTAAWRYSVDADGRDLYGIDSLVLLINHLLSAGIESRFLVAFGDFNVENIPRPLLDQLLELRRTGYLIVLEGQRELWPIFDKVDLFLRLTSTDGESVSVLEALHFDCSVLASNVVPRPAAVVTYKYGDKSDLIEKFFELYKCCASEK
ncbi:hypothetical protein [Cupriavidus sp. TMH.W2]|uniref:hypothetical protein n=1 Tax=Cupriavidus sp. TMH.W2 TaxID=3434465 RepID=UPI003D77DE3A